MPTPERSQAAPPEGAELQPSRESERRVSDTERAVDAGMRPEDVQPQWQEMSRGSENFHAARINGFIYIIRLVNGEPALFRRVRKGVGEFKRIRNFGALVGTGEGQMTHRQLSAVQAQMEAMRPAQAGAAREEDEQEQPVEWREGRQGDRVYYTTEMNGFLYVVSHFRGAPTVFRRPKDAQSREVAPVDLASLRGELSQGQLGALQEKLASLQQRTEQPERQQGEGGPVAPERTETVIPLEWERVQLSGKQCLKTQGAVNGYVYIIHERAGNPVLYRSNGGPAKRVPDVYELVGEGEGTLAREQADTIQRLLEGLGVSETRERTQSPEEAFAWLESITVLGGKQLEFSGSATDVVNGRRVLRRNFFRTRNIVPDRMDDFVRSVENGARMLDSYVRRRSGNWQGENWEVHFDGAHCYAKCPGYQGRAIATPSGILREDANRSMRMEDGREVNAVLGEDAGRLEIRDSRGRYSEDVRYHPNMGMMSRDVYDGGSKVRIEFYDGRTDRPTMIRSHTRHMVTLPVRAGSSETANYTLEANKLYILGGQGPPYTDYKTMTGDMAVLRQRGPELAQRQERLEQYAKQLAQNLGTPEAIGSYVGDILSESDKIGSSDRDSSAIRWEGSEWHAGYQDVQHPLETLFSGKGDCEDQAGAAKYLLSLLVPPVNTVVTNTTENHYQCIYVEESVSEEGTAQYNYCRVEGLGGFYRSPNKFHSPGEAIRSSFASNRYSNSAEMDLATIERRGSDGRTAIQQQIDAAPSAESRQQLQEFYADLRETAAEGGITTLSPPSFEKSILTNIDGVRSNCAGKVHPVKFGDEAFWARYTRFAQEGRRRSPQAVEAGPPRTGAERVSGAPRAAPARTETAPVSSSLQAEWPKIEEMQREHPRNQWATLRSGQAGYRYLMDNAGNLFASREPGNRAAGYKWLNRRNYTWEQHSYS